jgi:hypothetical protein
VGGGLGEGDQAARLVNGDEREQGDILFVALLPFFTPQKKKNRVLRCWGAVRVAIGRFRGCCCV